MKIKTYRAKNLCEAFAKIREDLGGQAAILETREVRKRGILGLFPGGTMLEVTASDGLEEVCEDVQDSCPSVDPSLVRIADREFSEVHEITLEKADVFEKKDIFPRFVIFRACYSRLLKRNRARKWQKTQAFPEA